MEYFTSAINQYTVFNGRATRKQYWMFILFYLIFAVVASLLDKMLGIEWISTILSLALLLPSLAIGARRLHDTGRTGWWQLIGLIPVIGFIVLIIFYVQDSQPDNEYGPNPKAAQV